MNRPRQVALIATMALGCSRMSVNGTVVDPAGEPIEDTLVTLRGTLCQDRTSATGGYSVTCQPGHYTAVASHDAYFSEQATISAPGRTAYEVPAFELFPEPATDGLWRLEGADYSMFTRGALAMNATEQDKSYCLPSEAPPNTELAAGELRLLDHGADDWKLFRLDEQGCAQRLTWRSGTWRIEVSDEPTPSERRVGTGRLLTFNLEPGGYFLADWGSGRFEVDATLSEAAGDKRYSGSHLVVR